VAYYAYYDKDEILALFEGKSVVNVDGTIMTLSDGTRLEFDDTNSDCCSYMDLQELHTTDNIITKAEFRDDEGETGGTGPYSASIYVMFDGGGMDIATATGDATNGYYLHGFALGVTVLDDNAS
jgi:hypothetical protein